MPRRLGRLAVAVAAVVTAAGSAGLAGVLAAPASSAPAAAACPRATGVTVVVDRGSLGGGIDQVCNGAGGGKTAARLFTSSGYSLTYAQRQPGFVCRIDGVPASDPCVNTSPADAYWGLWWSNGRTGSWSYSSLGAASLTIPDGGYVAFAWQSGSKTAPGVPATAHASSPTPTATPSTAGGGGDNGGGGHSASPSTKPSAKPSTQQSTKPSTTPSTSPSTPASTTTTPTPTVVSQPADPTTSTGITPTPSASDSTATTEVPQPSAPTSLGEADGTSDVASNTSGDALPVWVVPAVLVVLAVGAGAAYVVRRRHGHGPPA